MRQKGQRQIRPNEKETSRLEKEEHLGISVLTGLINQYYLVKVAEDDENISTIT